MGSSASPGGIDSGGTAPGAHEMCSPPGSFSFASCASLGVRTRHYVVSSTRVDFSDRQEATRTCVVSGEHEYTSGDVFRPGHPVNDLAAEAVADDRLREALGHRGTGERGKHGVYGDAVVCPRLLRARG